MSPSLWNEGDEWFSARPAPPPPAPSQSQHVPPPPPPAQQFIPPPSVAQQRGPPPPPPPPGYNSLPPPPSKQDNPPASASQIHRTVPASQRPERVRFRDRDLDVHHEHHAVASPNPFTNPFTEPSYNPFDYSSSRPRPNRSLWEEEPYGNFSVQSRRYGGDTEYRPGSATARDGSISVPGPPYGSERRTERDSTRRTRHGRDRVSQDVQLEQKIDAHVMRWNLAHKTDITLHSNLEVAEDMSVELEQFSLLCRLGNFAAAKHHFATALHDHKNNLYVHVQYVHMLLQSGDYKTINSMESISKSMFSGHGALGRNYNLMRHAAMIRGDKSFSKRSFIRVWGNYHQRYMDCDNKCSSTELQSLATLLQNKVYISRFWDGCDASLLHDTHNGVPYADLLREGQIWDCRDVLAALIQSDPRLNVLPSLFGESDALGLLDINIKHWESDASDKSTALAILDITEAIMLASPGPKEQFRRLLEKATLHVSSLVQDDPDLVASRQYLRWMLAKLSFELYDERPPLDTPAGSPGMFLTLHPVFRLPLYVPYQSEMPTLFNRKPRPDLIPLMKTALDGAKSMADYETEVMCLQALIYGTEQPAALYDDLARLQKETQGDIQGCLQTYLSKYIFCNDHNSRIALREDILNLRYSEGFPTTLLWARAMILRALSVSEAEASIYLELATNFSLEPEVSSDYRSFMMTVRDRKIAEDWKLGLGMPHRYAPEDPRFSHLPHHPYGPWSAPDAGSREPVQTVTQSGFPGAPPPAPGMPGTYPGVPLRGAHALSYPGNAPQTPSSELLRSYLQTYERERPKSGPPGSDDVAVTSDSGTDSVPSKRGNITVVDRRQERRKPASSNPGPRVVVHHPDTKRENSTQTGDKAGGSKAPQKPAKTPAKKSDESEDDWDSTDYSDSDSEESRDPPPRRGRTRSKLRTRGEDDKPKPKPNEGPYGNANKNQPRSSRAAPTAETDSDSPRSRDRSRR